jgi:RNA polymerase sigma-70 factor, ECF subfamily
MATRAAADGLRCPGGRARYRACRLALDGVSPPARAAVADGAGGIFLLHEVFEYDYREIAAIVERSEDNCRQLAVRARRHVEEHRPRFEASQEAREQLATRFFDAVGEGDFGALIDLLADDVAVYADGGGKVPSATRPVVGRGNVVRLMLGLHRLAEGLDVTMRRVEVNGQPGAMFFDEGNLLINVWTLDILDGQVQTVRTVSNPDKLGHLGPLADITALVHRRPSAESGGGR